MTSDMRIEVYNWQYVRQGPVVEYTAATVTWAYLDSGEGELILSEDTPFASLLLDVHHFPVMMVITVNGVRWPGRVLAVNFNRLAGKGSGIFTVSLISEWVWLHFMLASQHGADPSLTGMGISDDFTGPAATAAAYYINAAAARLAAPVYAVTPVGDTSGVVTLNARFPATQADLLIPMMAANGISLDVDLWLPGDDPPTGTAPDTALIVFTPRMVRDNPALRWVDTGVNVSGVNIDLTISTGYEAIVGLDGQDAARVYDQVVDVPPFGTGGRYALPEIYVDAAGTALGAASQQQGLDEVRQHRGTAGATFSVAEGNPHHFGDDYVVGDTATLWVAGVPFAERVTRVQASRTVKEGLVISPTLGDPVTDQSAASPLIRALASLQSQLRLLQRR